MLDRVPNYRFVLEKEGGRGGEEDGITALNLITIPEPDSRRKNGRCKWLTSLACSLAVGG